MKLIQIHPRDNVAVALDTVAQGETISLAAGDLGKIEVTALEEIPKGHKIALTDIEEGGSVIKYGTVIAIASTAIKKGSWIHTHNAHTGFFRRNTSRGVQRLPPAAASSKPASRRRK